MSGFPRKTSCLLPIRALLITVIVFCSFFITASSSLHAETKKGDSGDTKKSDSEDLNKNASPSPGKSAGDKIVNKVIVHLSGAGEDLPVAVGMNLIISEGSSCITSVLIS